MKRILSERHGEILAQFAWSRVLVAFDFDGTLAPIVADRDAAAMRASTRSLLERVSHLYPCAVISGRSCDDVSGRTAGIPLRYIMGNHGLEPGAQLSTFERQAKAARQELVKALDQVPGVEIEDKQFSLAVHYRRSRRKRDARKAIHATVEALGVRMRTIPGKLVVNLVPEGAPHKGDALMRLRAREGVDTAIYVGDDSTDEDVFELDQPGRLLSIRVGCSRRSSAPYYLRDQREIDALLRRLARIREENGRT